MAGRRQTLYRVIARHRATGEWAGQSMLAFNDSWLFILIVFTLVSPAILLLGRGRGAGGAPADAH